MVKTHEVMLSTSVFNKFTSSNYLITKDDNFEPGDFVLFKQAEVIDDEQSVTGLYSMTSIQDVIKGTGLESGYVLLIVKKL